MATAPPEGRNLTDAELQHVFSDPIFGENNLGPYNEDFMIPNLEELPDNEPGPAWIYTGLGRPVEYVGAAYCIAWSVHTFGTYFAARRAMKQSGVFFLCALHSASLLEMEGLSRHLDVSLSPLQERNQACNKSWNGASLSTLDFCMVLRYARLFSTRFACLLCSHNGSNARTASSNLAYKNVVSFTWCGRYFGLVSYCSCCLLHNGTGKTHSNGKLEEWSPHSTGYFP